MSFSEVFDTLANRNLLHKAMNSAEETALLGNEFLSLNGRTRNGMVISVEKGFLGNRVLQVIKRRKSISDEKKVFTHHYSRF